MVPDDSWASWSRLVLHELEQNRQRIEELEGRVDKLEDKMLVSDTRNEGKSFSTKYGIVVGAVLDFVIQHWPKNP